RGIAISVSGRVLFSTGLRFPSGG
ncbi:hypothetical protein A2U01_0058681, partial [Trifolium medium]|nr:hypothetical protein [Trifolium medium]